LHNLCKNTFSQIHQELEEQNIKILGKDFNENFYDSVDSI